MVNPLFGAIATLGFVIGGAIYMYFQVKEQQDRHRCHTYRPPPLDYSNNTGEQTCVICLDPLNYISKRTENLQCGHKFHQICIQKWFEQSTDRRCPVCRIYVPQ